MKVPVLGKVACQLILLSISVGAAQVALANNTVTISSSTCGCFSSSPSSPFTMPKNSTVGVTFSPGSGFTYSSGTLSPDGSIGSYSGGFSVTPKNGSDGTAYTASISCTGGQTVTVNQTANGTIASSGNCGNDIWKTNSTATYLITPAAGYVVTSYNIDGTLYAPTKAYDNSNPLTVTFPVAAKSHTITASYSNTATVTVLQSGAVTGTVTSCSGSNTFSATGTASFGITPTVAASGASLISSITVAPTSPLTGASQTIAVTNGGTGYSCSSNPLTFPMNEENQTLTVSYTGSDAVVKTINTDGSASATGGSVSSCSNYGTDNWQPLSTASYSITPNTGYVLSGVTLSPATATTTPVGNTQAAGYGCGAYTFPIGAQTQSLTANFATAVPVTGAIQESSLASNVNLTCNNSTGVCSATDKASGVTVGTLTSCNGSNSWGKNQFATYMVAPANGFMLTSVSAAGTTNGTPPAGGYGSCANGYSFNAGTGTTLTANFVPSVYATIYGTVVDSSGVSGGDILVGGASAVSGSTAPYHGSQNVQTTATFSIPAGAGIKSLYWTPSGGGLVDVTAMVSCGGSSPIDYTGASGTCQFVIPATTGTTPSGTTFTGVGTAGGTLKVVYDKAYAFTVSAATSTCGGGSNGGLVNGAGSKTYNVVNGSTVTVTGVAAAGYAIKDVTYNSTSIGVAPAQLGTSYSYAFGPINSSGNTGSFLFTPVFTVNSNGPVSTPAGSTATGSITPGSQQVLCGNPIQPITISPTPPATVQDVKIAAADGTTTDLGAVTSLDGSTASALGSVQKSWTITATFYQAPINTASYSIVPPFVQSAVLPNLLLMIDNSASQYDLQYDSTGQCYDNNAYTNTTTYAGYFNNSSFYSYNAANNRFEAGATLPGNCTYLTSYFCVNMNGTKPNRTVSNFVASGNFLNYLTMSKLDIQKLILTGGKYDTTAGNLVPESRGCDGKRFVKIVSNTQAAAGSAETLNNLTFVIRGPNAGTSTNFNPAVQGGTTHIDIYDYSYANQIASCQTAFNDWSTGVQQGTTQNDTNSCISSSVTNPVYNNELQLIHSCYYTIVKGNSSPPPGQTNNVESGCQSEYTGTPATAPSSITNNQAGDAVCSSVISHAPINGSDVGYVGQCWDPNSKSFTSDSCVNQQILNFCAIMQQNQVTDPSTTNTTSSSYTTVMPGFFMDAGINSLGNPAGTYLSNVKASAPSGLIAQFSGYINFGAMTFNQDGSGSECVDVTSSTTIGPNQIPCARHCSNNAAQACYYDSDCGTGNSCVTNTKLDGSKVVSYISTTGTIGDHSTGLINALDNIQATSWTPWGEAFYDAIGYFANNTSLRLQSTDWDANQPPPSESCRLNNILMITDGVPTADQNATVGALAQKYNDGSTNSYGTCNYYEGSKNIAALAWTGYNRDIHNLTVAADHNVNNQYISTYIAYSGPQAQSTDPCDPFNLMTLTAKDGNNGKTPLYYATTYTTMLQNLQTIFKTIATSSASGTGASILNNSQGSGANLLQAVFFPKKAFNYTDSNGNQQQDLATWIGELQNLWFYVDPYLGNSTVREDTNQDYQLSMTQDDVVSFGYSQNQATVTLLQDQNGDGSTLVPKRTTTLDGLNSLWKAGRSLWNRNLTSDPRKIYTLLATPDANGMVTALGTGAALQKFSSVASDGFDTSATAQSYLQISGSNSTDLQNNTDTLVNYISGIDQNIYRSRAVTIPNCGISDSEGCKREWKLGDIVSSTPKLDSNVPLNTYAQPNPTGYADSSYSLFTGSNNYQQRGMAFVGGNDGMLHAFRLGVLDVSASVTTTDIKAQMEWPAGTKASYPSSSGAGSDLGREEWAFIPMNALPYLKYLGDPNYTHLYYVDDTVSITDMSINPPGNNDGANFPNCSASTYYNCQKKTTLDGSSNVDMDNTSWRTVLIGGMGLGGATRDINSTCTSNVATGTCVKLPITGNVGYSSFFALDVTNPHNLPGTAGGVKLLWEFNGNGQLGYSLSAPAIVRTGSSKQNGRWFAVFGSGPTGPIDTSSHTFYGKSDQNLKLFVVDIATGTLVTTIDTGIANAFAGSLTSGVIDTDRNYSDDAIYIGYVQADTSVTPNTWSKGGVLRLVTHQSMDPAGALDQKNKWTLSTVINGLGPITTSVTKLQDPTVVYGSSTGKLWLYFGTGRYFYKTDTLTPSSPFQIYGVNEPCYSWNTGGPYFTPKGPSNAIAQDCTDSVDVSKLVNQTGSASSAPSSTLAAGSTGWFVNLAMSETVNGSNYSAERVITNPNANNNGTVFFSTLLPTTDVCGVGGDTYIWAFKYDTGGVPLTATMKGSILLQVSTGDLQQVNLSDAFNNPGNKGYNLRRLAAPITGVPPTGSGMVGMNRPQPTKRLLHIQER